MEIRTSHVVVALIAILCVAGLIGWFALRPVGTEPNAPPTASNAGQHGGAGIAGSNSTSHTKPGAVTGTVLVFSTKKPAKNISVHVVGEGASVTVTTDTFGAFTAKVPSQTPLTVSVEAPSPYAPIKVENVFVKPGRTRSLGTLYLSQAFLVKGIVVDGSGKPIADADVKAYLPAFSLSSAGFIGMIQQMSEAKAALDQAKSKGDGSFTFRHLSPGTYRFVATAKSFAAGTLPNAVVSPESKTTYRIVLSPGIGLHGTVKTSAGTPVAGATVTVMRNPNQFVQDLAFEPVQTTTDSAGKFDFEDLVPGLSMLMVNAKSYPIHIQQVSIGQKDSVDVVLGGTASISGKVTDTKGNAVAGASLRLIMGGRSPALASTESDAAGEYRFEHLAAGPIQMLSAHAKGFAPYPETTSPFGGPRRTQQPLKEGEKKVQNITLHDGATIEGRVTNSATGQPLVGADVSLLGTSAFFMGSQSNSTKTDKDGKYTIEGAGTGRSFVVVKAPGFVEKGLTMNDFQRMFIPSTGNSTPPADSPMVKVDKDTKVVTKDLTVVPCAKASGVVLDPQGKPVAGAKVTVKSQAGYLTFFSRVLSGNRESSLTNDQGEFEVTGLTPNESVAFTASADGWVDGTSDKVALSSGEETKGVTIHMKAGGTITGTIVGADGTPVTGAAVHVAADTQGPRGGRRRFGQNNWRLRQSPAVSTDEQGRFRVTGMKPGPIVVGVIAKGYQGTTQSGFSATEGGETDVGTITLEKGLTISGTVVDEQNQPLAGVRIWVSVQSNGQSASPGGVSAPFGINLQATTGSDGTFSLSDLPPGTYRLSLNLSGYVNKTQMDVEAGSTDVSITMEKGLTISGVVLAPDGQPASGVTVSAASPDSSQPHQASSDSQGEFKIENLPAGVYTLTASSRNFAFAPSNASSANYRPTTVSGVQAGSDNVQIRMQAGYTISGTITDKSGNPVSRAFVIVRLTENPSGSNGGGRYGSSYGVTDSNGHYSVAGLGPGRYTVGANANGYQSASTQVNVSSDMSGQDLVLESTPSPQGPGGGRPRRGRAPPRRGR